MDGATLAATIAAIASVGALGTSIWTAHKASQTTLEVALQSTEAAKALERTRWTRERLGDLIAVAQSRGDFAYSQIVNLWNFEPSELRDQLLDDFRPLYYMAPGLAQAARKVMSTGLMALANAEVGRRHGDSREELAANPVNEEFRQALGDFRRAARKELDQ